MADDSTTNMIPSLRAAGRFEAKSPFDKVVNLSTYYTVEALHTLEEMEAQKLNLYSLIFQPVGVSEADYPVALANARAAKCAVCVLTSRNAAPIYVISTYFKSFPMVDGVAYERMVIMADCGALPPSMSDTLTEALTHFRSYLASKFGLDAAVTLGTVPTIGYVSAEEARLFELTRKNKITDDNNDVSRINALTASNATKDAYIATLEAKVIALTPK